MYFKGKVSKEVLEQKLAKLFDTSLLTKSDLTEYEKKLTLYHYDTKNMENRGMKRYCHVSTYNETDREGWIFDKKHIIGLCGDVVKFKI